MNGRQNPVDAPSLARCAAPHEGAERFVVTVVLIALALGFLPLLTPAAPVAGWAGGEPHAVRAAASVPAQRPTPGAAAAHDRAG